MRLVRDDEYPEDDSTTLMAEPDPQQLQQQLEKLQSGLGGSNPTGLPGLGGGPALPPGFNPFKK